MLAKPLTEEAKAYASLLKAANHMLELLQKKNYKKVHDVYFADIISSLIRKTKSK